MKLVIAIGAIIVLLMIIAATIHIMIGIIEDGIVTIIAINKKIITRWLWWILVNVIILIAIDVRMIVNSITAPRWVFS